MTHEHDHRTERGSSPRSWLRSGPLVAFVVVSFLSARHAYLAQASAAQHTAALLSLVISTALLTYYVSTRILRAGGENAGIPRER